MALAFLHNKRPGIAKVPHTHDFSYKKIVYPPTCETWGATQHFCKCGASELSDPVQGSHRFGSERYTDDSGHWYVCEICGERGNFSEHTPGTEATNVTPQTCTECGYILAPATCTHDWKWRLSSQGTCTEGAWWERTCSLCGAYQSKTDAPLGHDMISTVIQEPSCVSKGKKYNSCRRCGYNTTEDIEVVAHTREKISAVPATCTAAGSEEGVRCSVCNTFIVEPQTILPHHIPSETIYFQNGDESDKDYHYYRQDCVHCGKNLVYEFAPHAWEVSAAGVKFCTICGKIV